MEKEKDLDSEIDRLVDVKMEISDFIGNIHNPQWQCLLRNRYVLGKIWMEIS